jgi:hypothetical protein
VSGGAWPGLAGCVAATSAAAVLLLRCAASAVLLLTVCSLSADGFLTFRVCENSWRDMGGAVSCCTGMKRQVETGPAGRTTGPIQVCAAAALGCAP